MAWRGSSSSSAGRRARQHTPRRRGGPPGRAAGGPSARALAARATPGILVLIALYTGAAAGDEPFGLEKRIPWTTSRLAGSPEPPLPYTVEKTFTKLALKAPIYIAAEPGTDRLLVTLAGGEAERPSRIMSFKDDPETGDAVLFFENGGRLIYSVCYHPDYPRNGFVFIFSNGTTGQSERTNRVTRYLVERGPPSRIRPDSEELLLEWRSAGHDGGDMAFGLDGKFYVTTGDGTSDSDTWNSGQTLDDLLGSVLRIDVDRRGDGTPYAVPPDNPFVDTPGARPEIWAYGLRNPWRLSADPKSGAIWVGNNGQDLWETAHLVRRGENYGWSVFEGSHPFYLNRKRGPTPHVPPTIEQPHAEFRSLTGGVVYRGDKLPDLDGVYVYGDYSSGRIWGMKHDGKRALWHRELADTSLAIAAFQVDQRGELLVADHGGGNIYRLVPAPASEPPAKFPARLSETGLFASVKEHRVDPALIPYSVNAPGWADGACAERFMALPGEARAEYDSGRSWGLPDGTALVQTLSFAREPGNPPAWLRVETRVLLRQQGEWAGYSYRWNAEQTDALLVPKEGADAELTLGDAADGGARRQAWRFPSRSECMACHSRAANFVLGLTGAQLNRDHDYGAVRDSQLRALDHIGIFSGALPKPAKDIGKVVDPYDGSADLEARARSYLHVNCSPCHVEAGGGNAKMELGLATARERMNLLGARPQHDTFGIKNAMLVAPGDPESSILLHRLSRRGRGQMPPLVTARADEGAVKLMRDWIAQLKPDRAIVHDWQMEDLLPVLEQAKTGRSFASGQGAFRDAGCGQCHRFAGEGGTVGPDLTGIGRRLAVRDLLESILVPSKVIADEYATFEIETSGGEIVCGLIEREDEEVLVLRPASSGEAPVEIPKKSLLRRERSQVSNMPAGMVNVLEKEQILDLLAYLLGEGDPKGQ